MPTTKQPTRTESARSRRVNMRLTPEALDIIKQACNVQQQDVTSFVLGAALERARAVLAEDRILKLSTHEVQQLEQDLERDPEAIPQLQAMLHRFGKLSTNPASQGLTQAP